MLSLVGAGLIISFFYGVDVFITQFWFYIVGFCSVGDLPNNISGGDLLCIPVTCYPTIQHTMGCFSSSNSALAAHQHCFPLFQSCIHIPRQSSTGKI